MDWLINPPHSPSSHPQSKAVQWFLMFQRVIMILSPSHKGTGHPIMEACSYCGSHATGGQCGACNHCVMSIEGEQMWRFINMHSGSVDSLRRVWWYPSLTRLFSFAPHLHPPSSDLRCPHSLPHCLSPMHFLTLFPLLLLLFLFMSHSSLSPSFILFSIFYLYHCM